MRTLTFCAASIILTSTAFAQLRPDGATASFRGALPPKPTSEPSREEQSKLDARLEQLRKEFAVVKDHRRAADADIFLKAVRYALDFQEWYDKKPEESIKKAQALLDEASSRIESLKKNKTPWMEGNGFKTLGFYSKVDNSPQPYGVEIPNDLKFGQAAKPVPMWIWLHGRGDTTTDLNFVYSRLKQTKYGQFQPAGTIVIHPFGRYCNGYKSAGETDVFESRDDAIQRFNVDTNRVVLAGFSMGGAGAWHIGAHFADQWAAVHTGAGFVDVKRYQKLTPEKYPPAYEQTLWNVYDVPSYARNFLNVPFVAYSGEKDKQRDGAEYMMEIFAKEDFYPPHLIGPGVEHKYEPNVLKEVQAMIENAVAIGRNILPKKIAFQTRTLAYNRMHWLEVRGLKQHWEDTRVDATWDEAADTINMTTKNVDSLAIHLAKLPKVFIDGKPATFNKPSKDADYWVWSQSSPLARSSGKGASDEGSSGFEIGPKSPGLQGPIEDAFRSKFLIVLPNKQAIDNPVDRWVDVESKHFVSRWRSLMRGDPLVKKASEVSTQDIAEHHLVLWGTPTTNSVIQKLLASKSLASVLQWDRETVKLGRKDYSAEHHVPVLIYPNPLNPSKYMVLNSGLTFREAHDKTNSLQNPKLPDWVIFDISHPPTAETAGKIVEADFFDERWRLKP